MKILNPFLLLSLTLLILSGCSLFAKKQRDYDIAYPPELKKVYSHLGEDKTASAHQKVDEYINKAENIHWYGHAYFLKASIYETENNAPKAIEYYRKAIQHSAQYDSLVEAKALYNLSFVHEKIQNGSELISNLLDLMKRPQYFDRLTSQVETPARLAAAYASQNKMITAVEYHKKAVDHFEKLSSQNQLGDERDEISKSLYYLGFAVFSESNDSFSVWRDQLQRGQKYLLASAEASKGVWSDRAVETLLALYDKGWKLLSNYNPKGFKKDPVALKKNRQAEQLNRASDFYDLIHRLRAEEFPLTNVNPRSKKIMDESQNWLSRLESFAQGLDLGPQMTRDQMLVQKKLTTPVDVKPKKVILNKEIPQPVEELAPLPLPTKDQTPVQQNIGKDPNL